VGISSQRIYNTVVTKQADLIAYIFDGQRSMLSRDLLLWMNASTRFTDFVETYRDKIRKKVRVTREPESVLDLRGELEVAARLLNDRRLAVMYEPYASTRRRGPDFAVTYRNNLTFHVEVSRIHMEGSSENGTAPARLEERIVRVLLGKLGQMQPGAANILALQVREELARAVELDRLMQEVKTLVEGKDSIFYAASGYSSPADFYRAFLHLSGMVLWSDEAQGWANKQARPVFDEKILRLVTALLSNHSKE
jgi:hypothetical protein